MRGGGVEAEQQQARRPHFVEVYDHIFAYIRMQLRPTISVVHFIRIIRGASHHFMNEHKHGISVNSPTSSHGKHQMTPITERLNEGVAEMIDMAESKEDVQVEYDVDIENEHLWNGLSVVVGHLRMDRALLPIVAHVPVDVKEIKVGDAIVELNDHSVASYGEIEALVHMINTDIKSFTKLRFVVVSRNPKIN